MTSGVYACEADQWTTTHNCAICGSDIDDFIYLEKVRRRSDGAVMHVHTHCLAEHRAGQKLTDRERELHYRITKHHKRISSPLAQLPSMHWDSPDDPEFVGLVNPALAEFAREFDPRQDGSALLLGPSGAGKTSAAQMLIRRMVAAEIAAIPKPPPDELESWIHSAEWRKARGLVDARRQTRLGAPDPPELYLAAQASLLVLDELGSEGQLGPELVMGIIDERYDRQLPTIATSGLTYQQFVDRYGSGTTRRLSGPNVGNLIDLHLESHG